MKNFILNFIILYSLSSYSFTLLDADVPGWSGDSLTIYVNQSSCPVSISSAMDEAVDTWNSVASAAITLRWESSSSISLASLQAGSHPNVGGIICNTSYSDANSGGQGTYIYSAGTSYGYVQLNATGGTQSIENYGSLLSALIAHEIGHMLNLGHSQDVEALMYYDVSSKSNARLAYDDYLGLSYLYPRNELGGDLPLGCGLVKSNSSDIYFPWYLIFFTLPLILAIQLRKSVVPLMN